MNKHRDLDVVAWYFIQSEPRQQNSAGAQRVAQGSECFDPQMRVGKLHAGQVKQEQSMRSGFPLIKKIKAQDSWSAIQSTRGESRVAGLCPQARPVNGDINIEPATNSLATDETKRMTLLLRSLSDRQVANRRTARMINKTGVHFASFYESVTETGKPKAAAITVRRSPGPPNKR